MYLWLELDKLKTTTVELDYPLGFGRLRLLVCIGGSLDRGRRFTLHLSLSSSSFINEDQTERTLQFLHFQTKLASPLLPLISLSSWIRGVSLRLAFGHVQVRTKRFTPTWLA
jgi:hypothetical protein